MPRLKVKKNKGLVPTLNTWLREDAAERTKFKIAK